MVRFSFLTYPLFSNPWQVSSFSLLLVYPFLNLSTYIASLVASFSSYCIYFLALASRLLKVFGTLMWSSWQTWILVWARDWACIFSSRHQHFLQYCFSIEYFDIWSQCHILLFTNRPQDFHKLRLSSEGREIRRKVSMKFTPWFDRLVPQAYNPSHGSSILDEDEHLAFFWVPCTLNDSEGLQQT